MSNFCTYKLSFDFHKGLEKVGTFQPTFYLFVGKIKMQS